MVMESVRLQQSMTIQLEHPFRVWSVHGLHIEDSDIPKDANVNATIVSRNLDGDRFVVGVDFTTAQEEQYICTVAVFSDLEELQKNFPHLFKLEGELYAFP